MKKTIFLSILFVFLFAATAAAAPSVVLNGNQLSFEVSPVVQDGTTLVPLRAIFEPLGADVRWEPQTRTVTVQKDNTQIVLVIDRAEAWVNDTTVTLSVPAQSIDGRTMVPLRFVSTALGATVDWDPDTQVITITSEVSTSHGIKSEARVYYIDVGQADSIYIQLPNHNDILIDGGNKGDGSTVVEYLKNQGVDDLELLIATHPHEDHIGGLPSVLDAFTVEKVIDSGYLTTSQTSSNYKAKVEAEGCPYDADNHQVLTFGDSTLEILTGTEKWKDANDYSVVCRLDTGDIEFLFTGDAEGPAEAALTGNLDAEILKVGHHGSSTSSSASFLDKVQPKVAIISVGAGNTYGHPDAGTLGRIEASGAKIYRTDLLGSIVITTDGVTFSVN